MTPRIAREQLRLETSSPFYRTRVSSFCWMNMSIDHAVALVRCPRVALPRTAASLSMVLICQWLRNSQGLCSQLLAFSRCWTLFSTNPAEKGGDGNFPLQDKTINTIWRRTKWTQQVQMFYGNIETIQPIRNIQTYSPCVGVSLLATLIAFVLRSKGRVLSILTPKEHQLALPTLQKQAPSDIRHHLHPWISWTQYGQQHVKWYHWTMFHDTERPSSGPQSEIKWTA